MKIRDAKIAICKNQLNDEKFADTTRVHETVQISHTHMSLPCANLCTWRTEARNTWLLGVKLFRKLRVIRRYSRKVHDRRTEREQSYIKCKSRSSASSEIIERSYAKIPRQDINFYGMLNEILIASLSLFFLRLTYLMDFN